MPRSFKLVNRRLWSVTELAETINRLGLTGEVYINNSQDFEITHTSKDIHIRLLKNDACCKYCQNYELDFTNPRVNEATGIFRDYCWCNYLKKYTPMDYNCLMFTKKE